ncbi:MAG: serine/threonine protein kinase [Deltaproteobacteria bacterium]|nr:serine/threonine protein kinase [Deltaproteobacteria bacterium]
MKSDEGVASTLVGAIPDAPRSPARTGVRPATIDSTRDTGVHSTAEYLLEPGTVLGEYQVEAMVGEGAMGTVFRAIHPMIGKRAALKVLKAHLCRDMKAIDRFMDEARAVNAIGHPNIVDIFAFGEMPDGRRYFAMELLVGKTLREHVRAGRSSLSEMARIVRTLARALEAAHGKGIVHRDLKPENVILVDMGDEPALVKLLDFGVAKLARENEPLERTPSGLIVGTPMYIPPEQARDSEDAGWASDVYSLGCIAFELLTGRPPFFGETMMEMLTAHVTEPPVAPSSLVPEIPDEIDELILKMLAKNPVDRPAMSHVRKVLERVRDPQELQPRGRIITIRQPAAHGPDTPTSTPASEPPGVKVRFAGGHPTPAAAAAAAKGAPWYLVIALAVIAAVLALIQLL